MRANPLCGRRGATIVRVLNRTGYLHTVICRSLMIVFKSVPFAFLPTSRLNSGCIVPMVGHRRVRGGLVRSLRSVTPGVSSAAAAAMRHTSGRFT